jgi:hypothetical protein
MQSLGTRIQRISSLCHSIALHPTFTFCCRCAGREQVFVLFVAHFAEFAFRLYLNCISHQWFRVDFDLRGCRRGECFFFFFFSGFVSRCSAISCGPEVFGSPNLTHTMAYMLFIIGETDSLFRPSLFHECDGILKSLIFVVFGHQGFRQWRHVLLVDILAVLLFHKQTYIWHIYVLFLKCTGALFLNCDRISNC